MFEKMVRCYRCMAAILGKFEALPDLVLRIFIAKFFLTAAWVKIGSWEQTIFLFTHEHPVPLLDPVFAAYLGTTAELLLPIGLVLGLAGRFSAIGLFFFNLVAVLSYEFLWTDAGHVGLLTHVYYGLLMLPAIFHGPGMLSIDHFIDKWLKKKYPPRVMAS